MTVCVWLTVLHSSLPIAVCLFTESAPPTTLVLQALPQQAEVVEKLPLVVKLTILNAGEDTLYTPFRDCRDAGMITRYTTLMVARGDRTYTIDYLGGPKASIPVPPADRPFGGGASLTVERVFSLVMRSPPPQRWAGDPTELMSFLPPGDYSAHAELFIPPDQKIVSDQFEFKVTEAGGAERDARDLISIRHVDFLEGQDRPLDEGDYDGRKSHGKVDVSRFGELQRILVDFPDSTYAKWIRFWKLYHHGPVDAALEYAREHRDFPLSDNLMLHVAEGLFSDKQYGRSREVLAELVRDFPDGDTHARAVALQEKLTKKP
jgi:hypothetical protein